MTAPAAPPSPDSNQLADCLARTALGDRLAFATLFEATKSKLFGVALRIVHERHVAEEVLQDSFVKIWAHAGEYAAAKAAPMTWMTAIVRNRALDVVRRPQLEVADEDNTYALAVADEAPSPLEQLAMRREEVRVRDCLVKLDAEQQRAIALAFFDGLSHSEVAAKLSKPLGTIKTNIRRGLVRLKACLDTCLDGAPDANDGASR
ncbi:MAG: sigma-70 family RNA polymerase sigma factor [Burkholderiales bacterium]|jgi:RNA polymerase sigma-70 factor (ECF subfamily)|nr:sigma-70 family RNA polymerase sigma factor [Nitrosomonadaceae bacterium]